MQGEMDAVVCAGGAAGEGRHQATGQAVGRDGQCTADRRA